MSTETTGTALDGQAVSISLTTKDLAASRHWYSNIVGFKVEQEYEREGTLRAVSLSAGTVRLLLNQDDGGRGWDRVKGEGFSYMVTTAQDIDAVANGIKARGGTLQSEPVDTPWGMRMFRLTDPDGYKVAIAKSIR